MARGDTMEKMEFLGMVGLHDPPRPKVSQAVDIFHSTGVKVVMVTGDAQETAVAIANMLNIYRPGSCSMSGDLMEAMSDRELQANIDNVSVFYRVTPRQKVRIVQTYQVSYIFLFQLIQSFRLRYEFKIS